MIIFADAERWYVDIGDETILIEGTPLRTIQTVLADPSRFGRAVSAGELTAAARATLQEATRVRPQISRHFSQSLAKGARMPAHRTAPRDLAMTLQDALMQRRSVRRLLPPSAEDIATVLFHSARVRSAWTADDGFIATSRPSPSAGGRHPFDLVVVVDRSIDLPSGTYAFDPITCALQVKSTDPAVTRQLVETARRLLEQTQPPPVLVYLVAEFRRTLDRYRLGATLVYRDAGALLATLGLTATAAGLATCIVATSGTLGINAVCDLPFPQFAEVGSIALGRSTQESGGLAKLA
jgi:SagB-type dehydrogenase family enzyme